MRTPSSAFAGPEHAAFHLEPNPAHRHDRRAGALLLHGFMGTPKELRPLAEALAERGIRAEVPLLPGFGSHVADLPRTTADDWATAVREHWADVQAASDTSLLIGFSFGAALALQEASLQPPDGLVLISPYTRLIDLPSWLLVAGLPVLKRTLKTFSPYAKADFHDPEVRRFFTDMDPDLDLDDPATQSRLRKESTVPFSVVDELRKTTTAGRKAANQVNVPTLIVQGTQDETSTVARTRALAQDLHGRLTLRELDGDHLIVDDRKPTWPELRDSVMSFTDRVVRPAPNDLSPA